MEKFNDDLPQAQVRSPDVQDPRAHDHRLHCGRPVYLRFKEFQLLWLLLQSKGTIVLYKDIRDKLWGTPMAPTGSVIRCYVSRIREKLGPWTASHIQNQPGMGYMIAGH